MKNNIISLLEKHGRTVILFCIITAVLGIAFSYIYPNEVLYSTDVNIDEDSDYKIPLSEGNYIEYKCNSGINPMAGIQVWICKEGNEFTEGKIIYEVYNGDSTVLFGTGEQLLNDIYNLQFVFLPFKGMKECKGDLTIKFYCVGTGVAAPVLIANQKKIEAVSTSVDGNLISGNLKVSNIYIKNTYPLVFDLKVMLTMFVTVFFTLERKK